MTNVVGTHAIDDGRAMSEVLLSVGGRVDRAEMARAWSYRNTAQFREHLVALSSTPFLLFIQARGRAQMPLSISFQCIKLEGFNRQDGSRLLPSTGAFDPMKLSVLRARRCGSSFDSSVVTPNMREKNKADPAHFGPAFGALVLEAA